MVSRNRVIVAGSLSTTEQWSTTFTFQEPGGAAAADQGSLQTWADNLGDAMPTLFGGELMNGLSSSGTISTVTVQYYDGTGPVIRQATSPAASTTGTAALKAPFQTCMVLSMRTGIPGASYRGRNYWPALGCNIGSTGLFNTLNTADAALRMSQALEQMSLLYGTSYDLQPGVYSPTKGLVTPVTSIQCGTVPDTQRRRRDGLVETYASVAYPPPA